MRLDRWTGRGGVLVAGAFAALVPTAPAVPASAGEADVVDARAECRGERCTFVVTVHHADAGWSHYANRFEILDEEGEVLATRVLHHPHVDEQPFTRALQDAEIPKHVTRVRVRAHDSDHGHGGAEKLVELDRGEE